MFGGYNIRTVKETWEFFTGGPASYEVWSIVVDEKS